MKIATLEKIHEPLKKEAEIRSNLQGAASTAAAPLLQALLPALTAIADMVEEEEVISNDLLCNSSGTV